MASLLGAITRVKRDVLAALDRTAVERACDELGHAWRDRTLDPATTVALFLQQVAHPGLFPPVTAKTPRASVTRPPTASCTG